MKDLVYLVGPPGVGKSTVMAALTEGLHRVPHSSGQMKFDLLCRTHTPPQTATPVGVELGTRRDAFSGTDALGMAVNPHAINWISNSTETLVLGEGARLANARFLLASVMAGYRLHLVHLSAVPGVLADRRAARGSHQNPGWIRGAETRAARIMESMQVDASLYRIYTEHLTPQEIADLLVKEIPILGVLR
jgi:ribose 1,5-bisphosphokinase PhnN